MKEKLLYKTNMKIYVNPYRNTFVVCFMMLMYMVPSYFFGSELLNLFYTAGYYLTLIITFAYAFFRIFKSKPRPIYIVILLYFAVLLLSTHINSGDVVTVIISIMLPTFAFCLFVGEATEVNTRTCLDGLLIAFEIIIYCDLLFCLLYPEGLYLSETGIAYTLFGHPNAAIRKLIPGLFISLVRSVIVFNKIRLRSIMLFVAVFAIAYITKIATMIIALLAFALLLILYKYRIIQYRMKLRTVILAYVVIMIFIVILNGVQYFSGFIIEVLHKDLTLTGRTLIWANTIQCIAEKPIWGYGFEEMILTISNIGYKEPHNFILELLYQTGIIGTLCMGLIIYKLGTAINKFQHLTVRTIMIFCFATYSIVAVFEPFWNTNLIYFMGTVALFYSICESQQLSS